VGAVGGQGVGHVPKAQKLKHRIRVCDRATEKALEGADRQTNRLFVYYSKI